MNPRNHPPRFSDEKLEEFYREFVEHCQQEFKEHEQQREMYEALFRKEDKSNNVSAGLIQLLTRTAEGVETLRIAADRQRTFIGGVTFALVSVWFFITDIGPVLADKFRKLF